jgi:hypothetical protein
MRGMELISDVDFHDDELTQAPAGGSETAAEDDTRRTIDGVPQAELSASRTADDSVEMRAAPAPVVGPAV